MVMSVSPEREGKNAKCVKCGATNQVTDTEPLTLKATPKNRTTPDEYWASTMGRVALAAVTVLWILGEALELVRIANLRIPFDQAMNRTTSPIGGAMLALVAFFIGWSILAAVDDTRANRRLLEEISKRAQKP